ncbi:MAG TPA: hypothetical protein VGP33_16365 [Chloroflexota bacterium]|jgi:hypothetical protein|nr:hypothetical protein [Chloroflexota bacterium]
MARYRGRWNRPDALSGDGDAAAEPPEETRPQTPPRDDAPVLEQLRCAEIVASEQLPQGSNYSFALGLTNTGQDIDLLAIYKPRRGEVPLWDFPPGTLYKRECAAYLTSIALGWQFIPPTVIREGPYGVGSVQLYVQPTADSHMFRWRHEHRGELMQIAVFDYITNNADRKAGHCLLDKEGRVWGIDHGLTFNTDPKLRTILQDFTGGALPEWLVGDIQCFASSPAMDDLLGQLKSLLASDEIAAFLKRLERVLKQRVFPRLDSYDSMPREWW